MKRIVALVLWAMLAFALSACNSADIPNGTSSKSEGASSSTSDSTSSEDETAFQKPENYVSAVLITINPQLRLYLDSDNRVLAVEPVNEDAEKVAEELSLNGKDFKEAVKKVVSKANEKGFIKENAAVSFEVEESKSETVDTVTLLNDARDTVTELETQLNVTVEVKLEDKTHEHIFDDATCTEPKKCPCGATEGEAQGHEFKNGKCTRCNEPDPDAKFTSVKVKKGSWKFKYALDGTLTNATVELNSSSPVFYAGFGEDIDVMYADMEPDIIEEIKKDPSAEKFEGKYYWMGRGSGSIPLSSVTEDGNTVKVKDTDGDELVLTRISETELEVTSSPELFSECENKIPVGTVLTFKAG